MNQRMEEMKAEVSEIPATFDPHSRIDDIRDSAGTIEITLHNLMSFDEQREMKNTISILMGRPTDKIKIIC